MSRATDALDVLFAAEALDRLKTGAAGWPEPYGTDEILNDCLIVARACTSPERSDEVRAKLRDLEAAGS